MYTINHHNSQIIRISTFTINMFTCLFQGLTQVAEMLISAVLPIMSLYHLPHGQYGYRGHVINLPQDVAAFANSLPRLTSQLDVIVVRKEGATESHRDFRVRRSVVLILFSGCLLTTSTIATSTLTPMPLHCYQKMAI